MADRPIDLVRDRLDRADCRPRESDSFSCRCPAHEDANPSLSVAVGDDDRVLLTCHAGCTLDAICTALKLVPADLFTVDDTWTPPPARPVTTITPPAAYVYVDEDGQPLYRAVREHPKRFRQEAADGRGGWTSGRGCMDGVRRVPYRLPQLLAAVTADERVYVVEGEKDADRLASLGLTATTNVAGAGKWRDDLSGHFAGARVVVLPDNDDAGRSHAADVADRLTAAGARVRVVPLDVPAKGDVSDWLDAGHTLDQLGDLVTAADDWTRGDQLEPSDDPAGDGPVSSWAPVDGSPYLDGTWQRPEPEELADDRGGCLFYRGMTNNVYGPSESGKTWLVLLAVVQALGRGDAAVYIDFEASAAEVYGRLKLLGASRDQLADQFRYVQPDAAIDDRARDVLHGLVADLAPTLVIIDGVTDAMGIHGLDPLGNADYTQFDRMLPRMLSDLGPAVVMVDHVPKAKDQYGQPIGAQHKKASVKGGSYAVTVTAPLAPGRVGRLSVKIGKDRNGSVRARHVSDAGTFEFDATDPDAPIATFRAPEREQDGPWQPTHLMQQVSEFLESMDEPQSVRAIQDAVTGRKEYVKVATVALVDDGHVERTTGARNAVLHQVVKPYREPLSTVPRDTDRPPTTVPASPTVPRAGGDGQGTHGGGTVPASPPPTKAGDGGRSPSRRARTPSSKPTCHACDEPSTATDQQGRECCPDHVPWREDGAA